MKVCIEWLCEHAGIARGGPNTEKYGDPFDYAITFKVEGDKAMIKALTSQGGASFLPYARALFAELAKHGLTPKWERFKR